MFSFKLKSFRPENNITEPHFFILCKGLNSGKPLSEPCPNCFICICKSEQEKEYLYWILFALWQGRRFHQVLCGSIIPFIRKKELSNLIQQRYIIIITELTLNINNSVTNYSEIRKFDKNRKMKFFLALLYITICFKSFSQLTLVEMKNILKMDLNKFETYALNRGYNFDKVDEEEKVFGTTYMKGEGNLSRYLTLFVKYYEHNRQVTYQTSETKEYLSFKNEIERDGFQLTKTENFEGTSLKFYSNSTYDLRIYVGKGEIADNVYEINLTRKIE